LVTVRTPAAGQGLNPCASQKDRKGQVARAFLQHLSEQPLSAPRSLRVRRYGSSQHAHAQTQTPPSPRFSGSLCSDRGQGPTHAGHVCFGQEIRHEAGRTGPNPLPAMPKASLQSFATPYIGRAQRAYATASSRIYWGTTEHEEPRWRTRRPGRAGVNSTRRRHSECSQAPGHELDIRIS
jgi:hypothetical protein